MSVFYLAYGSNLWRRRIRERVGNCDLLGLAWTDEFTLRFHKLGKDGSGKCDAFRSGGYGERLYGALYELSVSQKRLLDGFEGPGYESRHIAVDCHHGRVEAVTFTARTDDIDAAAIPFDWYKALVVAGAREIGVPVSYLRTLQAVSCNPDGNEKRARDNFKLLDDG